MRFLFELDQKAEAERIERHVLTHCPADDPTLRGLLRAAYQRAECKDLVAKFEKAGDRDAAIHAAELYSEATKHCRRLLSAWTGRLQS